MTSTLFPLFSWVHDPNGGKQRYTHRLQLPSGTTLADATVTAVDDNDVALVGDLFTISELTFGVISGDLWGVTYSCQFGTPQTYKLRCRYTLSDGTGSDKTMRLRCEQT